MSSVDRTRSEPHLAVGALVGLGAVVALVLFAGAGGYDYHRDELYFLVAGDHLAWGFADQGPLTPFLAHVMDGLDPGSVRVLRIPAAVLTAVTVTSAGALAFELGGTRRAQLVAAGSMGVGAFALFVGHVLSTSTFDLTAWALVTWLVARAVRTGHRWLWPIAGAVAGLALLNKALIAFLLLALGVGILISGPRPVLRDRRLWAGVAIALALWSPWVVWQAAHGWPQLDVSSSIASGGSGSSQARWAFLPFQFLLVSPVLAPIWIAGLAALLRRSSLRRFRFFAVAWIVLVACFLITDGKPYYVAGMFPVLLAAGAIEVDRWLGGGAGRARGAWLVAALVLSGAVSIVLALPILPERDAGPVVAMNGDVGETIGWRQLARTVADVSRGAPGRPVIFTANYGEAGAVDRYGPALGLPDAYSGHNAFGDWGPPPDRPAPVVVVGLGAGELAAHFTGCRLGGRVANAAGIDNDERGVDVELCSGPRRPWSEEWSDLRHLG